MPTTISSPATLKCISKGKNYTIGKKLTCANSLKEAHTVHGPTNPSERTMHQMCDYVRENPHTPVNDTFMVLVTPPTTYGLDPNLI
jgi:hypothetical protein